MEKKEDPYKRIMNRMDEARYGRTCLLVLNICPFTLRKVIDDFYTRSGSQSLQDFLDKHKHDLFHLLSRSCCCRPWQGRITPMIRSQWELLYDKNTLPCHRGYSGDCPCKYNAKHGINSDVLDITLCILVIYNICPGINMTLITTIREIRNRLVHASSASLDEPTYLDYWNRIKSAILDLAHGVSGKMLTETKRMVQELECRVMNSSELQELGKLMVDQKRVKILEERVEQLEEIFGRTNPGQEFNIQKTQGNILQLPKTDFQQLPQKSDDNEEEQCQRLHIKLLYETVAIDYLHPRINDGIDLQKFKARCRYYLQTPEKTADKEIKDILEDLERGGFISVGCYDILKEIVRFNVPLVNKIEDVERGMKSITQKKTQTATTSRSVDISSHIEDLVMRLDFCEIVPLVNEEYNTVLQNLNRVASKLVMTGYQLITDSPDTLQEFNRFQENCKDFHRMIAESEIILRLFYYFDNESESLATGHGKELVKLAEKGTEIIKDNPEKFKVFQEKWAAHNQQLKQMIAFSSWVTGKGAEITKHMYGSIILFLKFESKENLESFRSEYSSGILQKELQDILVTEDFLRCFRLQSAKVKVSVDNFVAS